MYHSIIFWDGQSFYTSAEAAAYNDNSLLQLPKGIHTWYDWHLIPAEKPAIALPPYESNTTEYFGRSGSFDITDTIYSGDIAYADRTGTLQFYIDHEREDWKEVRGKIVTALHGKVIKMVLEDDPGYYFKGRVSLTAITPGESYSQLTLSYQLEPYRYPIINDVSLGQVLWDPFNFETDYDLTVSPDYQELYSTEGVL